MNKAIIAFIILSLSFSSALAHHDKKLFYTPSPQREMHGDILVINRDYGGPVADYMIRYGVMQHQHFKIAINGECYSSCTMFLGYMPRQDICVTAKAKLGFHRANRPEGTMVMLMKYPEPVVIWIMAQGLTEKINLLPEKLMGALFQACPDQVINPPPPPPPPPVGNEKVD